LKENNWGGKRQKKGKKKRHFGWMGKQKRYTGTDFLINNRMIVPMGNGRELNVG